MMPFSKICFFHLKNTLDNYLLEMCLAWSVELWNDPDATQPRCLDHVRHVGLCVNVPRGVRALLTEI